MLFDLASFRDKTIRYALSWTIVAFVLASATWSEEAKAPPPYSAFLNRWAASKEIIREGKNGPYSGRFLLRFVTLDEKTSFSIGSIIAFQFPKKGLAVDKDGNHSVDREATAEDIRKAMGFKSWNKRRQRDASVFESEWEAGNRIVRIYMWESAESFSYSIASFRPAYADSFALESELIQRNLAGVLDEPLPWMQNWLSAAGKGQASAQSPGDFWSWLPAIRFPGVFPEAHAQPAPCPTCPPGAPPTCWMAAANCNQAQLSGQINTLNGNMANAVTAMNGANVQATNANANWATSNAQFNTFNQNFAQANQHWGDTNVQFQRTNDLLEKFMRPENAFIFAAATASGAAVGALAVNLAVEGLSFVGAAIYEAITHAKDNATRLAAFIKAREIWEKASSAAAQLESTIDSILDARRIAKGFGLSREQLISQLATRTVMTGIERDAALRRATAAHERGDKACFAEASNEAAGFNGLLTELNRLNESLEADSGDREVCGVLIDKLRALRMAEGQIQQARLAILTGQQAFMDQQQTEFEDAARAIRRLQNPRDHASALAQRGNRIDAAETNYRRAESEINRIVERERSSCIREVDDGVVCDRLERDTHADTDQRKRRVNAELRRTNLSESRRTYLEGYLTYLVRWERWYKNTWLNECRDENSTNIGAQIPIIGIAFRASSAVRKWCDTYLNGRQQFRDLIQRKIEARNARDSAVAAAWTDFRSASRQADATFAHNPTHESEMNAWTEWFTAIRDEQACLVSELACDTDANENLLMSRFQRLRRKVPQIEQVCRDTTLGLSVPTS